MSLLGSSAYMVQACLILIRLAHGSASWLQGWPGPGSSGMASRPWLVNDWATK